MIEYAVSDVEGLLREAKAKVDRANAVSKAVSALLSFPAPYAVLLNPRISLEDGLVLIDRHNRHVDEKVRELLKLLPGDAQPEPRPGVGLEADDGQGLAEDLGLRDELEPPSE